MMFKQLVFAFCFVMSAFLCDAQNKEQEGLVKTRGRLDSEGKVIPGVALPDASVILKGGNSTVSEKNGEFSILVSTEKYYLQSVQKQGYEIVDQDVLSKQYAYSKNPLVIVMEMPQQQFEDELAAERKIRRTLTRQLHEREDEIERLKEEKKISDEEYRQALNKLYDDTENNEKLISDMAERCSKIDYDYLDDFYVKVSNYILNGELAKADSMLNTRGNIDSDIESLNQLRDANAKERAELSKRQKKLKKSEAMAQHQMEDIAQRCYSKYEIFKMQHQNDSALYYLELRASLDTMNVEWMLDVSSYVRKYFVDYDKALIYCDKALKSTIEQNGENSEQSSIVLNEMGLVYDEMVEYDKAIESYERALDIAKTIYGHDTLQYYEIYNNIGTIYVKKDEYDKALEFFFVNLKVSNDSSMSACHNIAKTYKILSDYEKSMEYYDKLLRMIREEDKFNKSIKILEDNMLEYHPRMAALYNGMAGVYFSYGNYERSLEYFTKSVTILEKMLGKLHPKSATLYNNMAVLCQKLGNYDDAIKYLQKACEIQVVRLGCENTSYATSLNNIGALYLFKEEYDMALEYILEALEIREKLLGIYNIKTASTYELLGGLYDKKGDKALALEYFIKSLEVRKCILEHDHISISNSYNNIAMIYDSRGDYKLALDYLFKALNIRENKLGIDNDKTLLVCNNIGTVYLSMGKYDDAMEYMQRVLVGWTKIFGETHRDVAGINVNIAKIYFELEDNIKSLEYYHKALVILSLYYDEDYEKIVEVKEKINEITAKLNKN